MPDEDHRQYLFVAIDRATRHVHVALKRSKSARSARAFLKEVIAKAPYRIHTLLTDNGEVNSRQRREGPWGKWPLRSGSGSLPQASRPQTTNDMIE